MKILALEPYHGGSHKAFISGWSSNSRHEWTVLGLPAYKWKWRMRHAAITFADQVAQLVRRARVEGIIKVALRQTIGSAGQLADRAGDGARQHQPDER